MTLYGTMQWALYHVLRNVFRPRTTLPPPGEVRNLLPGSGVVLPAGSWWVKLLQGSVLTQMATMGEVNVSGANLLWVCADAPAGGNGSMGRPFKAIQDAINMIPAATDAASMRSVWIVMIMPGTYDEDLDIDGSGKNIVLAGLGPWNLGQFDSLRWQPSGAPRSITWHLDGPMIDDILPSLRIYSLNDSIAGVPWESYTGNARISGDIHCTSTYFGKLCALFEMSAEVYGSIDHGTGYSGTLWTSFRRSAIAGPVMLDKAFLYIAELTSFSGLLTLDSYGYMRECVINSGMTVNSAPSSPGFMNTCIFFGTLTGPPNSGSFDAITWDVFNKNAASFAGGATLVLTDRGMAKQTDYTPIASGDWAGDPSNVQDAIDRMAAAVAAMIPGPIP